MGRKLTGRVCLDNGKYIARIRDEYLGRFDTEREAWERCAAAVEDEKQHMDKHSVRVLGAEYLAKREEKERRKRGTHGAYVEHEQIQPLWDRWVVKSAIVDMRVEDVTPLHIQTLADSILGQPRMRWSNRTSQLEPTGGFIGKRTVEKVLSLLRGLFRASKHLLKGKPNPVREIDVEDISSDIAYADKDKIPHLHLDEIKRLFALPLEVCTPFHQAVFACGIYGGMRRGEVAGLRWCDIVDLDGPDPEIWIRRSYRSAPKNHSSTRDIPMLPQLVKKLQAYKLWLQSGEARLHTYRQIMPDVTANPLALVFPGTDGSVRSRQWDPQWRDVSANKDRKATPGLRTLAGIRKHIQHKHVRHSCATHLLLGSFFTSGFRWDERKVAQLLGHSDTKMTFKHYASQDITGLKRELTESLTNKRRSLAEMTVDDLAELLTELQNKRNAGAAA